MHICQSVKVFVFIHADIRLFVILLIVGVHHDDLPLQFFILLPECLLFPQFFFNGYNEFPLHFILTRHVTHFICWFILMINFLILIFIFILLWLTLSLAGMALAKRLTLWLRFWLIIRSLRASHRWLSRLIIFGALHSWFLRTWFVWE